MSGSSIDGIGDEVTDIKRIRLRYVGTCRLCGAQLPAGLLAVYERTTKSVRCVDCPATAPAAAGTVGPVGSVQSGALLAGPVPAAAGTVGPVGSVQSGALLAGPVPPGISAPGQEGEDPGVAGASARREFERRRAGREARIRTKHPRLGGLILAVSDDPQSTKAWAVGAQGEQRLGRRLDSVTGPTVRALHDRRIPRTRANIDHIVTCPSGVFVIDAKQYKGRPQLRVDGGIIRERTEKLLVGSRDCSKLVDGVLKQAELVRGALHDESIPVRGFLCFVDADWPLFGGSFTTRDVTALWPKKLADIITAPGPCEEEAIATIHERLAKAFPIA